MILEILFWIMVLMLSIIFHEFGHYVFMKLFLYDLPVKMKWEGINPVFEDDRIEPVKQVIVLLAGILMGLVPLLFFLIIFDAHLFIVLFFIGCHIIGSENDINEICRIIEQKTRLSKKIKNKLNWRRFDKNG